MRRRWTKLAAALAIAAMAVAILWYAVSPWWTLWRIREAARAGDLERMAAYVDYDEISARQIRDFRMWMRSVLETVEANTAGGDSFRAYAARQLARPDSDLAARPEDARPWLASLRIAFAGLGPPPADGGYPIYLVRQGLDGFEVREPGANSELGPVLSFRREGLGWRLVGMRVGQQ